MQEILAQQRNAAKPVTGKGFLLGVTGVIVKLSIAQLLVNLLIVATGIGLLNIAFYLFVNRVDCICHFYVPTFLYFKALIIIFPLYPL